MYSDVESWAKDYLEQLTMDFDEEVKCIHCQNGSRGILEVIKKYIKKTRVMSWHSRANCL